jgi:hypothetical protein
LAPLPDLLAALECSIADRQGAVVDEQLVQGVRAPTSTRQAASITRRDSCR